MAGRIDYQCLKMFWGRLYYYLKSLQILCSSPSVRRSSSPASLSPTSSLATVLCGSLPLGRHTSPSHWHLTDIRLCHMAFFRQGKESKCEMTPLGGTEKHGPAFSLCRETSTTRRAAAPPVWVLQWRRNRRDLSYTRDGAFSLSHTFFFSSELINFLFGNVCVHVYLYRKNLFITSSWYLS